ncbi:MAG TPA: hypothetical protein EYP36_10965 [Calditrichaeota bacterium]|nr:hypothetical protein [Calditrichota bacterium]
MKNLLVILGLVVFLGGSLLAQDSLQVKNQYRYKKADKNAVQGQSQMKHGIGFVDENGDGYNDNAPDHDGDGIPNGMDEDYNGAKARKGNHARGFVDADGDGINDNAMDADGDGIPNGQDPDFVRPQDGSGQMNKYGRGKGMKGNGNGSQRGSGMGSGDCDGTGPKGKGQRGGK